MNNINGFDAKEFLRHLTTKPGVYRMLGASGEVLYVGKAKNLKSRVSSYFQRNIPNAKTRALVAQICNVEITTTHTENEALILENNLIKSLKPRYNILLRDDKSYPYIFLSVQSDFPRLGYHRGTKKEKGRYFGPYPSGLAVRESLNLLQKLFPVRQCEDVFYRNRSRPCLQYQIRRCTAPCVGLISKEDYQQDVRHAEMFLEGRNNLVIDELVKRMEDASSALDFEKAAMIRDQIASLRRVQEKQYVSTDNGDIDIIAVAQQEGKSCVQLFYIRAGRNLGNKSFFPKQVDMSADGEILTAFIAQHYLDASDIPQRIFLSASIEDKLLLEQVLSEQAGRQVKIRDELRGDWVRWMDMAQDNARIALRSRLASHANMLERYEALQDALGLDTLPQRLECFDISHTMGEATVASCVVFDNAGPLKTDYRRFNIEDIQQGDDYAAMRQALMRRYTRLKRGEGKLPDILFIDGGKGQLSQAEAVLEELQIPGVSLVGVAKGPERKPGLETLFLSGAQSPIILSSDSPALHLIQQIRDEAHRFAITGHRQRRGKVRKTSVLEDIAGLGQKRRQQLLKQLGGIQEVQRAGVDDLAKITGISRELAQRIYDVFHPEEKG